MSVKESNLTGEDFKVGNMAYYENTGGKKYVRIIEIKGDDGYAEIHGTYFYDLEEARNYIGSSNGIMDARDMFPLNETWRGRLE